MKTIFRNLFLPTVLGILLFSASAHAAAAFQVTVNTSSLIGSASAPFALDFQFNNGSVLGNNSVVVSSINFGGGAPTGSPTLFDGATGSLSTFIAFNNSGPFQELYQTFTPGLFLQFHVLMTTNIDGAIPDAFVFAILDKDLATIPTSGVGDSLLLINVNGASPKAQASAGTGIFSDTTVSAAAVPEPASYAMILAGLPLVAFAAFRRRR